MAEYTVPQLQMLASSIATTVGISVPLFLRLITQESAWNPSAVNPVSGCTGLCQLHPRYFGGEGIDLTDPEVNLRIGSREIYRLWETYRYSWFDALARYNHGAGNVQDLIARHGEDWAAHLPSETKSYIDIVLFGDDAKAVLNMRRPGR